MPKYTPGRAKIEAKKVAKSFLKHGSGIAIARQRGTTPQNETKKLRQPAVQDCIQTLLNSTEYKNKWLNEMLAGAHESEKSISAAILVQQDGTVIKADDHGGITMPDRFARHKYLHDLGVAMGALKTIENKISAAVFIGSDFKSFLQGIKNNKVRSNAGLD